MVGVKNHRVPANWRAAFEKRLAFVTGDLTCDVLGDFRQLLRPATAGGAQATSSRPRPLRCSISDLVSFPPSTFPSCFFFSFARALGGCQAYALDPPFPLPLVITKTSPPSTEEAVVTGHSVVVLLNVKGCEWCGDLPAYRISTLGAEHLRDARQSLQDIAFRLVLTFL